MNRNLFPTLKQAMFFKEAGLVQHIASFFIDINENIYVNHGLYGLCCISSSNVREAVKLEEFPEGSIFALYTFSEVLRGIGTFYTESVKTKAVSDTKIEISINGINVFDLKFRKSHNNLMSLIIYSVLEYVVEDKILDIRDFNFQLKWKERVLLGRASIAYGV